MKILLTEHEMEHAVRLWCLHNFGTDIEIEEVTTSDEQGQSVTPEVTLNIKEPKQAPPY